MMKLHERLRRLRTGKHMTQAEVAERLHVTRQTVSSYESGRTEPDVEKLKCLAKIYGVTLEELLRFEAPDKRNTGRRALRVLRGTEALILICTLVRSVLLWVANRFLPDFLSWMRQEVWRACFCCADGGWGYCF